MKPTYRKIFRPDGSVASHITLRKDVIDEPSVEEQLGPEKTAKLHEAIRFTNEFKKQEALMRQKMEEESVIEIPLNMIRKGKIN